MSPTKPFPWRCIECDLLDVQPSTIRDYGMTVKHDGQEHEICIPEFSVPQCQACGAMHYDIEADRQVQNALRTKVGLLSPDRIRAWRTDLSLTHQQVADALGIANETVSRWESGAMIQSKSNDRFMRIFFQEIT